MVLKFIIKKLYFSLKKILREYQLYNYSKKHHCNFGENINFLGPLTNIKIGENTTINGNANFRFVNAVIKIGNDCLVARNVTILTRSYHLDKNKKISTESMYSKDVNIGNNVLIGGNVIIMPGVTIGNNSVVGAGSIVTKNIGDLEIWTGVPAKFVRKRNISGK